MLLYKCAIEQRHEILLGISQNTITLVSRIKKKEETVWIQKKKKKNCISSKNNILYNTNFHLDSNSLIYAPIGSD